MNRRATKWFVMIAVLITAGAVAALSHAAEANLKLSDAWMRPTLGAGRTTAAYLTITNAGTSADRLIAAELPDAASVEVHTAGMTDGVMRMRRLEAVDIPAGETVQLAPGGIHIMVIGLNEPIAAGTQIPLTLVFEEAGPMTVSAEVSLTPPASSGDGELGGTQMPEAMPDAMPPDAMPEGMHHGH